MNDVGDDARSVGPAYVSKGGSPHYSKAQDDDATASNGYATPLVGDTAV